MDKHIVISKINGALNVLRRVEAVAPTLTKKQQREMPLNSVTEAIRYLEIAKAEVSGEPWPAAPAVVAIPGFDPAEFVDN